MKRQLAYASLREERESYGAIHPTNVNHAFVSEMMGRSGTAMSNNATPAAKTLFNFPCFHVCHARMPIARSDGIPKAQRTV